MARKIEAERGEFLLQPVERRPILRLRQRHALPCRRAGLAEEADLLACPLLGGDAGMAEQEIDRGKALRAVGIETIEGAGADKALELAPIEALHIEAAREIEKILEWAVGVALGDDLAHRGGADALHGRQRVADRRAVLRLRAILDLLD